MNNKRINPFVTVIIGMTGYFLGGLTTGFFTGIRQTHSVLYPRVPLIAVGIGSLILGIFILKGKDIFKLMVVGIISYLAVILVSLLLLRPIIFGGWLNYFADSADFIKFGLPTFILGIVTTAAYTAAFGAQLFSFENILKSGLIGIIASVPVGIIAGLGNTIANSSPSVESIWIYISFGAAVGLLVGIQASKKTS